MRRKRQCWSGVGGQWTRGYSGRRRGRRRRGRALGGEALERRELLTGAPEVVVWLGSEEIADNRTAPAVDWGEVYQYGAGPELTFVVQNTGTDTLRLGSVRVPSGFAVGDRLASRLEPYESDTFTVWLTTSYAGTFAGEIEFSTNDADEDPFNFAVCGVVKPPLPEIVVYAGAGEIQDNRAAPPVDFGSAGQGSPGPTVTFSVYNSGMGTLALGTPQVPNGYTVTEQLASSLAAGAWDTFTVRLNTVAVGTFAGEIRFSTNDEDEDPFNFAVTGQVVAVGPQPEIAVSGSAGEIADGQTSPPIDFGRVDLGAAGPTQTFTVRNEGAAVLTLGGVLVPSPFTVIEPLASSLAPGASDTFTVRLNTDSGGTFVGQIRIGNNDADENPFNFSIAGSVTGPAVEVSIDDVVRAEGDAGETDFTFTVSLSTALLDGWLTLGYRTKDGSAVANDDYWPLSGTLSFAPGETSQTLTVKVLGEKRVEADETFFVELWADDSTSSSPVEIADAPGQGTIRNDDFATLSINDVTVTEGNAGDVAAVFTVRLSRPVEAGPVSVSYRTADGSAAAGQPDYRAQSGSVSFATGTTVQTISVSVVGDTVAEWDETFYLLLSLTDSAYVTLADDSGVGRIVDDDEASADENPPVRRILHQWQCCCNPGQRARVRRAGTVEGPPGPERQPYQLRVRQAGAADVHHRPHGPQGQVLVHERTPEFRARRGWPRDEVHVRCSGPADRGHVSRSGHVDPQRQHAGGTL